MRALLGGVAIGAILAGAGVYYFGPGFGSVPDASEQATSGTESGTGSAASGAGSAEAAEALDQSAFDSAAAFSAFICRRCSGDGLDPIAERGWFRPRRRRKSSFSKRLASEPAAYGSRRI